MLYDCGKHGQLSLASIAKLAGITVTGAHQRVRRGIRGEALCRSAADARREGWRSRGCSSWVMITAVTLARKYHDDALPTVREIQAIRPMAKAAATRWRAAFRDARDRLKAQS